MLDSKINMATIRAIKIIEELTKKSKNGIIPLSEVTKDNVDKYVVYKKLEDEKGYPIALDIFVDPEYGDINIISTYDFDEEYTIRVKEDEYEPGRRYIEFCQDDDCIIIDNGDWHFV